jgi:uncharacterized protein (DUF1800 family)
MVHCGLADERSAKPNVHPVDAGDCWAPYSPSAGAPWNLRRVVHLHRRAGFAATWRELQRDLADGPDASIRRLLAGKSRAEGVPPDFNQVSSLLVEAAVSAQDPGRLKAWWVYRMLFGPDPLGERLTLLWHNHFATSVAKVGDLALMHRQNELFRERARAPFSELLSSVVRDPALLVWLDAPANRREHPNENLARELMELFTVGLGAFTEADVKESARALTGWSVTDDRFRDVPVRHDPGQKSILGKKGPWRGDDLIKILLDHPAMSVRLATRLCELFMGEEAANAALIRSLAKGLHSHNLDIGWGVKTILRSEAFFAEANLGSRVSGPAEYVVGAARALEMFDPPPSTVILADWITRLGQDLFSPPNVFGWPGGKAWITTRSVIGRANFAAALVTSGAGRPEALDALGLARSRRRAECLDDVVAFYCDLLLGRRPDEGFHKRLNAALGTNTLVSPETARQIVTLILASPEGQLA